MRVSKSVLEQHIAVFGESGSGKTVLLSCFYGATQEPQYLQNSLFHVVADDIGQGTRLHRNYLGMKNSARLPEANRFAATAYSFSVKLREASRTRASKAAPFDALRLVWHDYPGEWFEQQVSGPQEARRRADTFRELLGSDVAILLVDGQRLLDNAGEEERYLKSLLANVRNGLLSLRDTLLVGGKPLVTFPRIWMLALSKADLLPGLDVFGFRDLMIEKAADDIGELRAVLSELVEGSAALSVGEDFLLLSSAKFQPGAIEVATRVGVELILPLAATLPFERHVRWSQAKQAPAKVAEYLLEGSGALAAVLLGSTFKLPGPLAIVGGLISLAVSKEAIDGAVKLAGDALKKANADALAKHNYLTATLTGFRLDLERGERDRVLIRSRR